MTIRPWRRSQDSTAHVKAWRERVVMSIRRFFNHTGKTEQEQSENGLNSLFRVAMAFTGNLTAL
jgi:hypothetical protein